MYISLLLRLLVGRGVQSYTFAPFPFFSVSKVGAPLMGDIAAIAVYSEKKTLFKLILIAKHTF